MRDALSELVRDVKDPRVRGVPLVSINHIDFNRDASIARIYVSFPGAERTQIEGAIEGLERATGFMRGPLGRAMRLRRVPRLDFFHDDGVRVAAEIADIVRTDEQKAARAAHDSERTPGDAGSAGDAGEERGS